MGVNSTYPRLMGLPLVEALQDSPVVLIHGPRQCGKTTLARAVGEPLGYVYLSFDDDSVLAAAREDPVGFVAALPARCILDEVQRVPEIFTSLKRSVDESRVPGRFLLTGSTNVLTLPSVADSLAGRMEILRLHPLAQVELRGGPARFLDALFSGAFAPGQFDRLGPALPQIIAAGGFPPALARAQAHRRAVWYRDYVATIVQRDVRDIARVGALDTLPRLLALAAGETARMLNVSSLAAPFQVSRPTIHGYVTLLTQVFLLDLLPPWHSNRTSRLVKSPKLHLGDTGVAGAVLGAGADELAGDRKLLGQLLETFVYQELRRQADALPTPPAFFHFRNRDGAEVDIVLEGPGQRVAGVEVKASATVRAADFRGLRKLRDVAGERFALGVLLYDGETVLPFGDGFLAVPLPALWSVAG